MTVKIIAFGVLIALSLGAFAQDEEVTATPAEELFIDAASQHDIYELASARLAVTQASDPNVIEFANALIEAHTRSTVELVPLASDLSYSATSDSSPTQSILSSYLSTLEGSEFDTAFLDQQVTAHAEAIEVFTLSSDTVDDPSLQDYLERTLAALTEHLSLAQALTVGQ